MQTAALIVAAGMSSRMGDFKPMLSIGSISIAQRVVATFQQAGIRRIVMVTGFNAVTLERHLSGNGVIFLRNEDYETTQMFDSVKIGLAYLRGKCDAVLFTPVDIPLFTASPVRSLLDSGAEPPEQALARFLGAMEEAARISPGDFAVVAHGGVMELFLQEVTGRRYKPRYCEVISLRWENGRFMQSEESL